MFVGHGALQLRDQDLNMVSAQGFHLEHEALFVHLDAVVQVSFHLRQHCHVSAYFCSDQIFDSGLFAAAHAFNLQKAQL